MKRLEYIIFFSNYGTQSKLQISIEKIHKSGKKKKKKKKNPKKFILFYFGPSWCDNGQKGIQSIRIATPPPQSPNFRYQNIYIY